MPWGQWSGIDQQQAHNAKLNHLGASLSPRAFDARCPGGWSEPPVSSDRDRARQGAVAAGVPPAGPSRVYVPEPVASSSPPLLILAMSLKTLSNRARPTGCVPVMSELGTWRSICQSSSSVHMSVAVRVELSWASRIPTITRAVKSFSHSCPSLSCCRT